MDERPEPQETETEPDLEYDLAHEEPGAASGAPREGGEKESVYVATQTSGYDGDYGYDQAHDVPGR
ncbi:MAG TPA: hypothetical protein VF227_03875 [Actinomycetes bacterium]|jgi:hypothetical protein